MGDVVDRRRALLSACLLALATGCGGPEGIVGCEDAGGLHPICGLQNPEDLAVLPGGRALLVSQFGTMDGSRAGNLAVLDLATERTVPVFPPAFGGPIASDERWGDPACPPPSASAFSPHGIDLSRRSDGRLQLLVVNHGARESIEWFEVLPERGGARVAWRGCAIPREGSYLNDVAALAEGGLLTTHMHRKAEGIRGLVAVLPAMLLGRDSGYALSWSAGQGFRKVKGTDAPFPNGIEVSPDGQTVYLNAYFGNQVRKIDRRTGQLLATAEVTRPDNVTWGDDGRLLVASHVAPIREMLACGSIDRGACPLRFQIVALDPETLASEVVLEHGGAPMGAATVAVSVGDALYLGSFAGDRVVRAQRAPGREP
jgi:hypothetical protein